MFDVVSFVGFVEGEWDGGSGGVVVVIDVYEEVFKWEFKVFGDGFDDVEVGLMGNYVGDLIGGECVLF